MKALILALTVGCVAGCMATEERPMRASEDTYLSQEVERRLDEAGGVIDVREHDDIRCQRVKLTGTHLVTRHCYTLAEEEAAAKQSQDRMERILNDTPRPRSGN